MFGRHKDTKRELTPQEQKMVIDELNDILNNPELKEKKIVISVDISEDLVDYDGVTNKYRDLDDIKVIKASWSKIRWSNGDTENKLRKFEEDIDECIERLKARHHIKSFGDALIINENQVDCVYYFFYDEED
jgi:hypothetical protein